MHQHSSLTSHFRSWFDWCFCNRLPVQVLQQIRKKWESRGTHRVYRARVSFLSLTEDSVFQLWNGFHRLFRTCKKKDKGIWRIKHILVIHTCHCEGNSSLGGAGNKISYPLSFLVPEVTFSLDHEMGANSHPFSSSDESQPMAFPQRGRKGQDAAESFPHIAGENKLSLCTVPLGSRLGWVCGSWQGLFEGIQQLGRGMEKLNFIPWKVTKVNS